MKTLMKAGIRSRQSVWQGIERIHCELLVPIVVCDS